MCQDSSSALKDTAYFSPGHFCICPFYTVGHTWGWHTLLLEELPWPKGTETQGWHNFLIKVKSTQWSYPFSPKTQPLRLFWHVFSTLRILTSIVTLPFNLETLLLFSADSCQKFGGWRLGGGVVKEEELISRHLRVLELFTCWSQCKQYQLISGRLKC